MKQTPDHFDTAVAGWLYGCYLAPVSDKSFYCRPIISQSIDAPRFVFKIVGNWQTHRQQCCRHACQISKQYNNSSYQCRGFEISQDLTDKTGPSRLSVNWSKATISIPVPTGRCKNKAIELALGHQTDVVWRHNDVIIASCVHWGAVVKSTLRTILLDCKCHIGANNNKIIFKSHLPISSHQNRN